MVHFNVDTGYQAGPYGRVTRDGYRFDSACLACKAAPVIAQATALMNAEDPLEAARLLRTRPYREKGTGHPIIDAGNKFWAQAVDDTWTRLLNLNAFGPATCEIVTTVGRWVNEWTFTYDRGVSQRGWFVPAAMPWVVAHGVERVCTERGLIDVWITEDGRALGRVHPYLPLEKSNLSPTSGFNTPTGRAPVSETDSKCISGEVILAVPPGKGPEVTKGVKPTFFKELVQPKLVDTITLSDDPPDRRAMNAGTVKRIGLSLGMAALLERRSRPSSGDLEDSQSGQGTPTQEDPLTAIERASELAERRARQRFD